MVAWEREHCPYEREPQAPDHLLSAGEIIQAYARIAALALLAAALAGWVLLGWGAGAVLYHAGLALLFAFPGFLSRSNGRTTRVVVGGLGVLLVAVKTGMIFVPLTWGGHPWHGPIEITCLVVGIASILAARYLPDDK